MTILPALAFGFVLGIRHATDADHISAVATVVSSGGSARRAAMVGASWGVGHSASVLLVGGALVLLRTPMPDRVALLLELMAALMLIGLGVRSLMRRDVATVVSSSRPFAVGIVHGLAGSAVLALLVLGATDSALSAAAYLVLFCVGTVAGMASVTSLFAIPSQFAPTRAIALERHLRLAAGVTSIGIGLAMAHRVWLSDGLLAAAFPIR